jgi:hypothetical protein
VVTLKDCSVTGADAAAIRLTGTSRTVLEDCAVRSVGGDGVAVGDDARVECTGSLIDGTGVRGVHLTGTAHGRFTPKASACMQGIATRYPRMFAHWKWVTAASPA